MTALAAVAEVEDPTSVGQHLELAHWRDRFGVRAGLVGGAHGPHFRVPEPRGSVGPWETLRDRLRATTLIVSRQPHGAVVGVHASRAQVEVLEGLDGHVTATAGVFLAVTVADCVPVYLVEPAGQCVGLLHAGWRGIAAGIVEQGIRVMAEVAKCSTDDVVIHCGVAICGGCYEVGPEVHSAVNGEKSAVRGPLDLRRAIATRADRAGVSEISTSPFCAAHDDERFVSYRQSHGSERRMVAYIGRPTGGPDIPPDRPRSLKDTSG